MDKISEEDLIGHDRELENQIFKKYHELRIEKELCKKCVTSNEVNNGLPVSLYLVGEDFKNQEIKTLFVGKTVQSGWESDPKDEKSNFIDTRVWAKQKFLPFWSTEPFWLCIKEICQRLWDTNDLSEIWKRISITNLVKCSTSSGLDSTPDTLKNNCIQAGFFEYEVKILQPTHIIFITGPGYDEYLKKINFGYIYRDIAKMYDPNTRIDLWQRDFIESDLVKMKFLRTYHPGYYKNLEDKRNFSQVIANWINGSLDLAHASSQ